MATKNIHNLYGDTKTIAIGDISKLAEEAIDFAVDYKAQDTPLELWTHLGLKLVLNTVSTATMCLMNRVLGNWMICAEATNKKLIDRGARNVSEFTGLDYKEACREFHNAVEIIEKEGKLIPPSALAIYNVLSGGIWDISGLDPQQLLKKLDLLVYLKDEELR